MGQTGRSAHGPGRAQGGKADHGARAKEEGEKKFVSGAEVERVHLDPIALRNKIRAAIMYQQQCWARYVESHDWFWRQEFNRWQESERYYRRKLAKLG